jgi:hypothetical protein
MNKLRTISIDPQFLNISKKKIKQKPLITNEININSNNIKQLLLEKLRQHKKSKKTSKQPMIRLNTLDEQNISLMPKVVSDFKPQLIEKIETTVECDAEPDMVKKIEKMIVETPVEKSPLEKTVVEKPLELIDCEIAKTVIEPDRPYGVLKNGFKPTYKDWSKSEAKEIKPTMIEEREIKKTFTLGKKNKSVGILIKNNISRKKIETDKINYKKTSLTTLKNHLKKHNLIKFGTTAPSELLRDMYEGAKMCGDISNTNATNIVHNFKEA